MILGRNTIIIDVEDAKKLLNAIRLHWDKKRITELIERDYLGIIEELDFAIRDVERQYERNYA